MSKTPKYTSEDLFRLNLRRLLAEQGLPQSDLAELIGKHRCSITFWLTRGAPHLQMLTKIAAVFDVPIAELFSVERIERSA